MHISLISLFLLLFILTCNNNILAKVPAAANGNLYEIKLADIGVTNAGTLYRKWAKNSTSGYRFPAELVFDDEFMTVARYPNIANTKPHFNSYTTIASPISTSKFSYSDTRPTRWDLARNTEIYVHGYLYRDWADTIERVQSIDRTNKIISLLTPTAHAHKELTANQRYYYFNIMEELDTPGEYYFNKSSGILYFWPPRPASSILAYVTNIDNLVQVSAASNIVFKGIIFEGARKIAVITDTRASDISLVNCTVRNTGFRGVTFTGGERNEITSSVIKNIGEDGIVLSAGNRATLTACNHTVHNSDISYFGRIRFTYAGAIYVPDSVGTIITHNNIHHAPHLAIQITSGNNHLVENNEIHHVAQDTGDVGAYYEGRDWTAQGNLIRYNYFHDIEGPVSSGGSAIYFDDQNSGSTAYGNIFYNVYRGVLLGGGRDNKVLNNIFINCTTNVYMDARGLGLGPTNNDTLYKNYLKVNVNAPTWKSSFPTLPNLLNEKPHEPRNIKVHNNIMVINTRMAQLRSDAVPFFTSAVNVSNLDCGTSEFVNFGAKNFQLKSTSSV